MTSPSRSRERPHRLPAKGAFAIAAALLATAGPVLAQEAVRPPKPGDEATFLAENQAAMSKMMSAMAIRPTGDIDRDFVEMMTPHHQAAIDMAQAELRYGRNERLRRLAQEIIVNQTQEIAAMHLAIGEAPPPSVPAPK
jgi:hypothetical protein